MTRSAPRTLRVDLDVKVGCDRCDIMLFILRGGASHPVLMCHGKRMTPRGAQSCADLSVARAEGMVAGRLYTDLDTGLVARCTRGGPGVVSLDGRPLAPASDGANAPGTERVGLVLEMRRIRWNAVDWACAGARQAGRRTLPVLLDPGIWWCQAELDTMTADQTIEAWFAVNESIRDAIAERILGWGLDPVIQTLMWNAPQQGLPAGAERPDFLVASRPGPLSWLSRSLIRRLRRSGWPVTLIR